MELAFSSGSLSCPRTVQRSLLRAAAWRGRDLPILTPANKMITVMKRKTDEEKCYSGFTVTNMEDPGFGKDGFGTWTFPRHSVPGLKAATQWVQLWAPDSLTHRDPEWPWLPEGEPHGARTPASATSSSRATGPQGGSACSTEL